MNLVDELQALEMQLLTGAVRRDAASLHALLAEEFREFGSSGRVFTRAGIVGELQGEALAVFTMKDFRAEPLSDGVMLVTYRVRRSEQGETMRDSLRSSIWVWREGRWQMVFHQGTCTAETAVSD